MNVNAHTILLVEDDSGLCELLSNIIADCGFEPYIVNKAVDALDWLNVHIPFLMILDYGLPDMTSKELISKLLSDGNSIPPFIVSTGQGDERVAVEMMKLGARDYVVKDINFLDLIPLVISKVSNEIENEKKIQRAERELLELSQFSNQIVNNVHEGIIVFDMNMNFKVWNPHMENLFGISASEILGKKPEDCFPFLKSAGIIENIKRALWGEYPPTIDYPFFFQTSGKSGWVSSTSVPLLDSIGNIIGVINSVSDITHRKQAEQILHDSQERYRSILSASPDAILVTDLEGIIELVSPSALNLFEGDSEEELVGKSVFNFLVPQDVEKAQINQSLRLNFYKGTVEYRILNKSGQIKYAELNADMIRNAEGEPEKLLLVIRNVTDRKLAEKALHATEARIQALFNAIPDLIISLDGNGNFLNYHASHTQERSMSNDLLGKNIREVLPSEVNAIFDEARASAIQTGNSQLFEYALDTPKGKIYYDAHLTMVEENEVLVVIRDITYHKKAELAIKENEEYISSILSCIPDLLFVFDSNGVYLDFKSGSLNDLSTPEDGFLGKNLFDVLPENVAKSIHSGIIKVLKNENVEPFEYHLDTEDKRANFECHLLPFGNNKVVALIRNITERKKAEVALGNSQEQLKNFAAHLQDVREEERIMLAREIHDELGQILVALKIDMGMLKQKTIKYIDPENKNAVLKSFNQIIDLIDSSLHTTRRIMTGLRPEVLEIVGFIEAVKLYTQEFQQRHTISCLYENSLSSLEVNPQQAVALYRIIQEALTNVVKHAKATSVKVQLGVDGNRFFMEISDNGIGLDTTHKVKMNSFGLIGMRERVYLLDGEFSITSQPGKGTCIRVEMPYSK